VGETEDARAPLRLEPLWSGSLYWEPDAALEAWFGRDGHPIGPAEWSQRMADDGYRCVAEHWVRGWRVSTVWLGMDQNPVPRPLRKARAPMIYETLLFGPGGTTEGPPDLDWPDDPDPEQARELVLAVLPGTRDFYPTADAAAEGHDQSVRLLVHLLAAAPWEVQTWEQHTGQQWAVSADGWRLVIEGGAIRGLVRTVCCQWHSRTCEPPSELCCGECTERNHPDHPAGETCSVLDLSPDAARYLVAGSPPLLTQPGDRR
jgi:hypothetical protein